MLAYNRTQTDVHYGKELRNIHGIKQIRFARGNIKEVYGVTRVTLKREFGLNLTNPADAVNAVDLQSNPKHHFYVTQPTGPGRTNMLMTYTQLPASRSESFTQSKNMPIIESMMN